MTSNLGTKEGVSVGFTSSSIDKTSKAIKEFFSPEFINRIDEIVYFESLDIEAIENIVQKLIDELNEQLKDKKVSIKLTKKAKTYLAKEGYSKEFGARKLKRVIQDRVKTPLSERDTIW